MQLPQKIQIEVKWQANSCHAESCEATFQANEEARINYIPEVRFSTGAKTECLPRDFGLIPTYCKPSDTHAQRLF